MSTTRAKVIPNGAGNRWQPPQVSGDLVFGDGGRQRLEPPSGDMQSLRQAARAEGFRAGHDAGLAAGRAEGRAEFDANNKRLAALIAALTEPLQQVDETIVRTMGDLVILVAKQLVRRELKTAPGEIVAVVRQALAALPGGGQQPRIRLHPDDLELVRQALGLPNDDRGWRLQPDPMLARGGCIVETDISLVDASVEARLSAIACQMLGGEREGDHA
ncbi:MAG: flagellar assembly protein FliH [Gammaproteobacteria bacterium]|nr:flagellar assembly protein FliH [Gammaproteobacteria bacterium]